MMAHMFKPFLGKIMEVYIDDILVKTSSKADHLLQLRESFKLIRLNQLCLSLDKCTFGVGLGKFLKYLVSRRSIEVSLE